jgi:hypothetical protein
VKCKKRIFGETIFWSFSAVYDKAVGQVQGECWVNEFKFSPVSVADTYLYHFTAFDTGITETNFEINKICCARFPHKEKQAAGEHYRGDEQQKQVEDKKFLWVLVHAMIVTVVMTMKKTINRFEHTVGMCKANVNNKKMSIV